VSLTGWSAAVVRGGQGVARRKRLEPPTSDSPLPPELRRQNVTVETFVSWDERPDKWCTDDPPYLWWRRLRTWRKWQDAVEEWGQGQGLDVRQLRNRGLWPIQPPRSARH
jgi:hypothetical protein